MSTSRPHALFSFGTLLDEGVQNKLFGQAVPATPATLAGYTTRPLTITDPSVIETSGLDVHLTLKRRVLAEVEGAVLHLTDADLAAADAYEVDDYARRRVRLISGETAWAYLDANPLRPASRIVLAGDSIAYGRCDPAGGWAARLASAHIAEDEADHRFFNVAIPGFSLDDVRATLPALLPPRLPDTIIIAAGINDSATLPHSQNWLTDVAENLDEFAALAQEHNARLVIAGPTWLDESKAPHYPGMRFTHARAAALRDFVKAWCVENHIDHLDLWSALQNKPELLADGIHPTPEGHQALYEHLTS
ncbi:GDSL-type esterase/lipase family protein [Actinomadura rupiterrae]|uniref:GDSL-type esterase/lipase family protein n=1 Tax=Actinomadura rupiterrae TaxID=559627 RepID=UPI0020A411D6|nr:GDSL-type esterase/lipase family protein [Actinomadura rupiterrae]MCP2339927.1 lysophospholipase L1-like esterase [Actinomadura rupiterrae]